MTAKSVTMRHVLLPVEGGALPLTVAESASRGAAVVIMPSAFGVAADLEEQMRELARDARLVVAPDPFFRQDAGPAPYDDMARVMKRLELLDRERAHRELRAAIDD
jgi:dienelactone hydrolase